MFSVGSVLRRNFGSSHEFPVENFASGEKDLYRQECLLNYLISTIEFLYDRQAVDITLI